MRLSDEELKTLAGEFRGGPVGLPEGADPEDTLNRLSQYPGLEGVHIAEVTIADGTLLMA